MSLLIFFAFCIGAHYLAILAGMLLRRNGWGTEFRNNPGKALLVFSFACLILAAIINPTAHIGGVTYTGLIIGGIIGGSVSIALSASFGYMVARGDIVGRVNNAIQRLLNQVFAERQPSSNSDQR